MELKIQTKAREKSIGEIIRVAERWDGDGSCRETRKGAGLLATRVDEVWPPVRHSKATPGELTHRMVGSY
jgi:hypothetical protein